MTKNKKIALAACGCILLLCIVVTAIGGFFGYRYWDNSRNYTTEIEEEDKNEILADILQKNPSGLSNLQTFGTSSLTINESLTEEEQEYLLNKTNERGQDNTYIYTKSSFEFGPAVSSCEMVENFNFVDSMERHEYYEKSANAYNMFENRKYVTYDADGNILMYDLYSNDINYTYYGGSYAIKIEYDLTDSTDMKELEDEIEEIVQEDEDTSEEEIDIDKIVETTFGENVTLEKVVEDGKIVHYIITTEEETDCSSWAFGEDEEYKQTIVNKRWLDAETFIPVKEEAYLNEVNEDNLLIRSESEIEEKQVDFDEVKDNFTFDIDVEVKEIDFGFTDPYSEEYLEILEQYFADEPLSILVPTDERYELSFVSSRSAYDYSDRSSYYTDRDFYASSDAGEKMYELFSELYGSFGGLQTQIMSITYGYYDWTYDEPMPEVTSFDLAIYEGDVAQEDIVDNMVFDGTYDEVNDRINVTINDNKVQITQYLIEETYSYESYDTEGETSEEVYTTLVATFTYNGHRYALELSNADLITEKINLDFKPYDTSKKADRDTIMQMIRDTGMYTNLNDTIDDKLEDME